VRPRAKRRSRHTPLATPLAWLFVVILVPPASLLAQTRMAQPATWTPARTQPDLEAAATVANFGLAWQAGIEVTSEFLSSATAARPTPRGAADLSNGLRCITCGVPRIGGRFADPDFSVIRISQGPEQVVVVSESIHDARVIPLDGRPHLADRIRQWNGDARGRWDGDTLIVDTTNFSAESTTMGAADGLQIVERFRRTAPGVIQHDVTLTDPTTWVRPWTVRMMLRRLDQPIYEFACHEGNYGIMRGMLSGARAEEGSVGATNVRAAPNR